MATQVQNRRGTTAEHSTFTGAVGELTVDTSKDTVVVHDGSTAGGAPLLREDGSNSALALGSAASPSLKFTGDTNTGIYSPGADQVAISTNGTGRLFVDASGNVLVGSTTTPTYLLDVQATSGNGIRYKSTTSGFGLYIGDNSGTPFLSTDTASALTFGVQNSERARIDTSGRLLVGTSTTSEGSRAVFQGWSGDSAGSAILKFALGSAAPAADQYLAYFDFTDSGHLPGARFGAQRDGGTWSASSKPSRLVFFTCSDGSASPSERLRINQDGSIFIKKQVSALSTVGGVFTTQSQLSLTVDSDDIISINRLGNDGNLIRFFQATVEEGNISVSGTTVSYNGAHLSRWSQLPGGTQRTEILRGTVLSNIDEMCGWGDEDNEQLNRMKVSDVEGDPNVSGVFQGWDDDDDTYTDDFYCAMTGDFIIRIAEGVTVQRGQLLMSAGDGTAKPQGDGFVQDKTIAKVTSTHVTCTYDDGSYCVPCVLMAC